MYGSSQHKASLIEKLLCIMSSYSGSKVSFVGRCPYHLLKIACFIWCLLFH